jgi:uncharacterized protein (TIGR00369 family)
MTEIALDENRLARIRETFSRVAYAHFLGLKLGEVKTGEATIHLEVRDELKQNQGVVHGGAVASIIDTASAFAVATRLDPGERVTTTDLTIHYLRPITEGELIASARIVRAGRRLFVVSVDVCNDKQALLATAVTGYIKLA